MPFNARMPSERSLSGLRSECSILSVAIERLLEGRLTQPPIGSDEAFVRALAAGKIGIDQRFDGVGHLLGFEAGAYDLADGGVLSGVAAQRDLVELAALLLDAQDADMADMVVA